MKDLYRHGHVRMHVSPLPSCSLINYSNPMHHAIGDHIQSAQSVNEYRAERERRRTHRKSPDD
jgi:hypothetical protein